MRTRAAFGNVPGVNHQLTGCAEGPRPVRKTVLRFYPGKDPPRFDERRSVGVQQPDARRRVEHLQPKLQRRIRRGGNRLSRAGTPRRRRSPTRPELVTMVRGSAFDAATSALRMDVAKAGSALVHGTGAARPGNETALSSLPATGTRSGPTTEKNSSPSSSRHFGSALRTPAEILGIFVIGRSDLDVVPRGKVGNRDHLILQRVHPPDVHARRATCPCPCPTSTPSTSAALHTTAAPPHSGCR